MKEGFLLKLVMGVAVVVVAVYAVSAALGPKKPYRPGNCIRQIKECVYAVHTYTEVYDGCLPSSALVNGSKTWNKADFETFATGADARTMNPGERRRTWTQITYDQFKSKDELFCPFDPAGDASKSPASYWWKLAADKAWYGENCKKACRKLSDFAYPASQSLLYEHNTWHEGHARGLRNGAVISVAFLDGHAGLIRLHNATSGDPINCAANSDGEPMYFNYNEKTNGAFTDRAAPATWVDPSECSDRLELAR